MMKSSFDSDKNKLLDEFDEEFWSRFDESADQAAFLRQNNGWQTLINKMKLVGSIELDFDATEYFKENNERWDQFFEEKPELFFKVLNEVNDRLSIILLRCEEQTHIKMIEEHNNSFADLLLGLPLSGKRELLQNDKFAPLLKNSFKYDKNQEKDIFSRLISKFEEITDDILRDVLQQITGLEVSLYFFSTNVQKLIVKVDPSIIQHASWHFQWPFVSSDIEYFKHAAEGVRLELVGLYPDKYFKHMADKERLALLKENPEEYLKYAAEYEQEEYLKKIDLKTSNLKMSDLISCASENVRLKLLKENPAELLKKVTVADQIDFLDAPGGFKFFQFATSFAQRELSKEDPEIWLKYAEDDIQRALSKEAPEVYLKHAIKKIQIDFLGQASGLNLKGMTNLKHAAPDVQFSLLKGEHEIWLDSAIQEVQLAVLFKNNGKDLHHASNKSRDAYEDNEYDVEVKKHHLEQVEMWEMLLLAEQPPQLPED